MQYRRIGKTDIEVSAVAMGCWAIVGDFTWGPQNEKDALDAIECALECGINLFDTAEAYGDGYSEQMLGRALARRRSDVVIATKVSPSNISPRKLRRACHGSLRRLASTYIDIYQIHWPNRDVPVEDTINALEKLKKEGKIRAAACSNFGPQDLSEALSCGRLESNQLAYNLLWRGLEYNLEQLCEENEIGILAYSPLAQGLLTGKFDSPAMVPPERARTRHFSGSRPHCRHGEEGAEELTFRTIGEIRAVCEEFALPMGQAALAYLLRRPAVASVIAGMRNPAQARQNAQAADLEIPPEAVEGLEAAGAELKAHFGPALDMWKSDERIR